MTEKIPENIDMGALRDAWRKCVGDPYRYTEIIFNLMRTGVGNVPADKTVLLAAMIVMAEEVEKKTKGEFFDAMTPGPTLLRAKKIPDLTRLQIRKSFIITLVASGWNFEDAIKSGSDWADLFLKNSGYPEEDKDDGSNRG